jgi:hypothetical protein
MKWLRRLLRSEPYPPEAAEAPSYVDGMMLAIDLAPVSTDLTRRIEEACERYRRGLDPGGARELSAVSHWTHNGWVLDRKVSPP